MQNIDNEIEATLGVLSETGNADLPDAFLEGVMSKIESGEISRDSRPVGRTMTLAAAAVVLLAGLNATLFFWPGSDAAAPSEPEISWVSQEYGLDPGSHLNLE